MAISMTTFWKFERLFRMGSSFSGNLGAESEQNLSSSFLINFYLGVSCPNTLSIVSPPAPYVVVIALDTILAISLVLLCYGICRSFPLQ